MERLTKIAYFPGEKIPCISEDIVPEDCEDFCEKAGECDFIEDRECPYLRIIDRLAAYEDTELEPEATAQLKKIAEIFNCDTSDLEQLKALYDKLRFKVAPNDPLTLDQLREMDGEPVWCEILIKSAKPSCYAIIHDGVATGFIKGKRINLGCDKIGGYGLAWVAYRRRPEEWT